MVSLPSGRLASRRTTVTTAPSVPVVQHKVADLDGFELFYREAGPSDAPVVLLFHGFPTSSHMFRNLIPYLADRFHVVAPDLPGFGQSAAPDRAEFSYTFDAAARTRREAVGEPGRHPVRGQCVRLRSPHGMAAGSCEPGRDHRTRSCRTATLTTRAWTTSSGRQSKIIGPTRVRRGEMLCAHSSPSSRRNSNTPTDGEPRAHLTRQLGHRPGAVESSRQRRDPARLFPRLRHQPRAVSACAAVVTCEQPPTLVGGGPTT